LGRALIGHTDKGSLNDWPAEGQENRKAPPDRSAP
jgi:hypothetical protein